MGKKWTREQKEKFKQTIAAKKAHASEQIFPLALIPEPEKRVKRANSHDLNIELAIAFIKVVQQILGGPK